MKHSASVVLGVAAAALAAGHASAATLKNGSPRIADYRGTPVAVVFFHPF